MRGPNLQFGTYHLPSPPADLLPHVCGLDHAGIGGSALFAAKLAQGTGVQVIVARGAAAVVSRADVPTLSGSDQLFVGADQVRSKHGLSSALMARITSDCINGPSHLVHCGEWR